MYYTKSQKILEEINKAKKILVNLHRGPDSDSFGSAFAIYYFLCSLGKEIDVVLTSNSKLPDDLTYYEESKLVKRIDYSEFDFSKYDLFITPDSGSWQQIVDTPELELPNIPIIVIDHHESNDKFGVINLVDKDAVSCAEVIFLLFKDWGFTVDKHIAELLMTGIITDSGGFAFSNDSKVMAVAGELMELGADKMEIIKRIFKTKKFDEVKLWGEYLTRMNIDEKGKFVWTTLNYEGYLKYGSLSNVGSIVATMFISIIDKTDFGVVMVEREKGTLHISFRSRSKFDVAKLAELFGGGGHKMAAGGQVTGLPFEKAVEKVLKTTRTYAKENS